MIEKLLHFFKSSLFETLIDIQFLIMQVFDISKQEKIFSQFPRLIN